MTSRFARIALPLGAASFLLGISIKALVGLAVGPEGLRDADEAVLRAVAGIRTGWLNAAATDFTALGSGTLLIFASLVIGILLITTRDPYGILQLAFAGIGASLLTRGFKAFFARPRPSVVEHLVQVSQTGFSYPSGHALGTAALYFSFALIARRHLPRHLSREVLIGFALALIAIVSASRVYLGVHYASDVVAGISIGIGWALLVAGVASLLERRNGRRSLASVVAIDEGLDVPPRVETGRAPAESHA
jgi:undecaprenyl-diphosphatase